MTTLNCTRVRPGYYEVLVPTKASTDNPHGRYIVRSYRAVDGRMWWTWYVDAPFTNGGDDIYQTKRDALRALAHWLTFGR